MRLLFAHNYYQQGGGEDAVVANERSLLADRGHEVRMFSVSNEAIDGVWSKIRTAWQAPYSQNARKSMAKSIAEFSPDVVHVHNFFPLLTPSIYDACRNARVPVVQTLHNYRTICPGALLMCGGRPYERCIRGSPYRAVLHRCYRGSLLGSMAVARVVDVHRKKGTWRTKVNCYIALTAFAKTKFVEAGFPPDKIVVKPNFVEDRQAQAADGISREGALFVGRLSPEKGVHTLLRAWSSLDVPLRVIGAGPLLDAARSDVGAKIQVLGRKPAGAVAAEMSRAAFQIMPSEWYEGFPMTLAEAFCHGLPVIASRLGAMAEIIEDGVTGLHFTPGDADDLAAMVRWATEHPKEMRRMGTNARRVYEEKYTPERNYRMLMKIYEAAIIHRRRDKA